MRRLVVDETLTTPLEKRLTCERSIERKRDQMFSLRNDIVDSVTLRTSLRHSNPIWLDHKTNRKISSLLGYDRGLFN